MRTGSTIRALWALLGTAAAGGMIAACGGSSTNGFSGVGDRDGGPTPGSSGGVTGAGGGGVASGGTAQGAGGSSGASGGRGAGGFVTLPGDAGPCAPPKAAGTTHLCLTVSPEKITARAEPELDEHGVLVVQIFNTPNPPATDPGSVALAERVLPKDANLSGDGGVGGEIALSDLKELEFENAFPSPVYVRVIFADNRDVLGKKTGEPGFGTWLGGVNVADGFQDKEPLVPVPLHLGQGNAVDVPLMALRRLRVTAHRTATPIGDGEGTLNVIAVSNADPATKPPLYGVATRKCADVATTDVTVTGFVVGKGPLWVYGNVNDLGTAGDLPPGSLASLDVTATKFRIPTELVYAATDYAVNATIDLNYVVPRDADAGAVPPNSCADLGLTTGDAGP